jgi:hypothetical protein
MEDISEFATMSEKSRFEELAKAHRAIVGMLESPLLSRPTRDQLETFRQELESEISAMNDEKAQRPIAS